MSWSPELAKIVGEFLGYIGVGVLSVLLMKFKDRQEKSKYPAKAIEASYRVREIMTEVRACFDADRVKIFQFKNGEFYTGGASEQKLVITHIVSRIGVGCTEGILRFQQVAVSLAGTFLKRAADNKIDIIHVDDIDEDSVLKGFFLMNGTSTIMTCRIQKNRQLIGLLVLTWMDQKTIKPKENDLRELDTYIAILEKLI
jgi:hypothetical protein